jgi:hypothetical protein
MNDKMEAREAGVSRLIGIRRTVARVRGLPKLSRHIYLGLTAQALCFRPLRGLVKPLAIRSGLSGLCVIL